MLEIFNKLQEIEHDNPMTAYDIESALEAYSKEYYNFTIADIEELTEVRIEYSNVIVHAFRWLRSPYPENECAVSGPSAIN